jgi:hypothetical protein
MRLHRAGWRSAYHNEVLARGLAAGGPDEPVIALTVEEVARIAARVARDTTA